MAFDARSRGQALSRRMSKGKAKGLDVSLEEQRRNQLLTAVMQCVAEEGFERATLRNIASRAGVSTGLLNYYFKTKKELVTAAMLRATRGAADDSVPYGPHRLGMIFRRSLSEGYAEALPLNFRLQVMAAAATDPDLTPEVERWTEYGRSHFQSYVETGIAEGRYRDDMDPRLLSIVLYGALTGLSVMRAISPKILDKQDMMDAAEMILRLIDLRPDLASGLGQGSPEEAVSAAVLADASLSPAHAEALVSAFATLYAAMSGAVPQSAPAPALPVAAEAPRRGAARRKPKD